MNALYLIAAHAMDSLADRIGRWALPALVTLWIVALGALACLSGCSPVPILTPRTLYVTDRAQTVQTTVGPIHAPKGSTLADGSLPRLYFDLQTRLRRSEIQRDTLQDLLQAERERGRRRADLPRGLQ